MAGMFSKLFGKKSKSTNKAISRRLELLGLEERITPATISVNGNNEVVIQLNGETITDLSTSINGNLITINTAGSANNTGTGIGLTVNNNSVVVDTAVFTNFSGILVTESTSLNSVTVGVAGVDLGTAPGGANQGFSINLSSGGSSQTSNVNGVIKAKGTGLINLNLANNGLTISAAGDITSSAGAVFIAATTLASAGDVTTGSGNISFGSALNPTGNIAITSTSGNLSMGIVTPGANNLTINQGTGTVALGGSFSATSGNLSITTTNVTASAINIAATTGTSVSSTGSVSLNAAGNISIAGSVSAGSVNAKSTAGDISFGSSVTTSQVGGFTSEATSSSKATNIGSLVHVQNGANALVTGNLVTSSSGAILQVGNNGSIGITGKVDAANPGNDLNLIAVNGAITIGGAVGSGAIAMGDLIASGNTSFKVGGAVTSATLQLTNFATTINFDDAVKVTGTNNPLNVSVPGTISFSKNIEMTDPGANMVVQSTGNGDVSVAGNIAGKLGVLIETVSGNITLAGVTNDQSNSGINILSDTGNITVNGAVSNSGIGSDIVIDTNISGDITMGGNVSTHGGGTIYLAANNQSSADGSGDLILNGTVTTTGSVAGTIIIGTGPDGNAFVNKDVNAGTGGGISLVAADATLPASLTVSPGVNITAGGTIAFSTFSTKGTITISSGANLVATTGINDSGTGNLNLGGNISATNGGILIDTISINLTGASSIKAAATQASVGSIALTTVNGTQNLTLEATGQISVANTGTTTPLGTFTVVNSQGSTFSGNFHASKVVLADTAVGANIEFLGNTTITNSLATATKGYNLAFGNALSDVVLIAGAPELLNLGTVSLLGNISLPDGGAITAGSTSTVSLGGTIVSGSYFNISSVVSTTFANNTQLILNSGAFPSTIVSPIILNASGGGTLNLLGVGKLNLTGDSSAGVTNADSIVVTNGTLNVTGKLGSASLISLVNGTISGANGTIGALNTTTGSVTPSGKLVAGGAITMNSATTYNVAITGSSGASNLESSSAINLGNALLNLTSVASGLKAGNQLTIINNTAAVSIPINGIFANLPEGSSLSAKDSSGNTVFFTISYKGTDGSTGNDAVLTVLGVQTTPMQPMVAGQPVMNKFMVVGADAGGGPQVTITFEDGTYTSFFAYNSAFTGGVRVAAADVNGDGLLDVVTGAGPGGGPQVNVFSVNVLNGAVTLQASFFAFGAPNFTGGVYVAAGDTNGDGFSDVIVGAGATGGSRVQVYAGSANGLVTGSTLNDFFAYSPAFTGGVVVAAGNRDSDIGQDVITAPASNGGFNVRSFNCNGTGNSPMLVDNFFAFNNTTAVGGLSLALQDLDGTPVDDIVIGSTSSQFGVVLNQSGSSSPNTITANPFPGFTGAIRAGVAQNDQFNYAVAGAGPGGGPVTTVYQVINGGLNQTDSLFVLNPNFTGGLFVSS